MYMATFYHKNPSPSVNKIFCRAILAYQIYTRFVFLLKKQIALIQLWSQKKRKKLCQHIFFFKICIISPPPHLYTRCYLYLQNGAYGSEFYCLIDVFVWHISLQHYKKTVKVNDYFKNSCPLKKVLNPVLKE